MVSAVRRGRPIRAVAREFGVSHATVMVWLRRAEGRRLNRADLQDRPSCPRCVHRTADEMEALVLDVRRELRRDSALGEYGAAAIRRELLARGVQAVPSVRTIGRILDRRGALDGRCRIRHPAPPRGWYLPDAAAHQAEVDVFDLIEDLCIQDGPLVDVLTATSLHGGLAAAWPANAPFSAENTLDTLLAHWRREGLPSYAQFDNDTRFQGAHQHSDSVSRVMRLCLSLGVTPVFTPPREAGFQAAIENLNRRWQDVVWTRFHHESLSALQERSASFIRALRERSAVRRDAAPPRPPFPDAWSLDLQQPLRGRLIYLRRTSQDGRAALLGHVFDVSRQWPYRLVRCEVDLDHNRIRFFALRRRDPQSQPLLKEVPHFLPHRRFRE